MQVELYGGELVAFINEKHRVTIPLDVNGLRIIKNMLAVQEAAAKQKANSNANKIASPSKPLQEMVDEFLTNKKLEREVEKQVAFNALAEMF